jgi:hypothetical protein
MHLVLQRLVFHVGLFLLLFGGTYAIHIYSGIEFDFSKFVIFIALSSIINVSAELFLLALLRTSDPKSKLTKVFFTHSFKFLCYLCMALLGSRFLDNQLFFALFLLFLYLFYALIEFRFLKKYNQKY